MYSRFDNINIINSYGPTECTFAVTSIEVTKEMSQNKEIPVGISKKDTKVYIVDENMNKLKDEEIGEILILGESVSDGYIGNIESKNFLYFEEKKAYLTGDLGYIKNGVLYYKERKDKQIKYKGYRIELTDIEENIRKLDYIDKVIVVPKKGKDDKIINIISFLKIKENIIKNEEEIKKDMQNKLPEYMCPKIKIVKEFPINENGKCDEKRLLEEL